jgi:tight adherence protein B
MDPIAITALVFCAVGALVYGFTLSRQQGKEKQALTGRLQGDMATSAVETAQAHILRDKSFSKVGLLNRVFEGGSFAKSLELWLLQARMDVAPGVIVLATGLLLCGGGYVGWLYSERIMTALIAGAVCASLPGLSIWNRRNKRFLEFGRQLPDALTMMKNSLKAGHTLPKAMQVISEEMPEPMATEFFETVEELNLGVPVKTAMGGLTRRIKDENLNIFVTAMLVQREVGGNLSQLLGNLSGTIRDRFRVDQEVRALTAEGRMSGYVVGFLPIALALVINLMQPDYLDPLLHTETGHKLLKIAATLEIVGFYFIRKASQVNY